MHKWTKKIDRKLFEKVTKNGKTYNSDHISFVFYENSEIKGNPTTFVVSKKVEKKAVGRNLVKRRGKHSLKKLLKDNKKHFASIFYAKKGLQNLTFTEFQKEIESLLKKANIL